MTKQLKNYNNQKLVWSVTQGLKMGQVLVSYADGTSEQMSKKVADQIIRGVK